MPVLLAINDEAAIMMNYIILHIIYAPILFIQVILFFLWNLLLYPIVYVKMFLHKLTLAFTYSRTYRDERNNKFLYAIAWIVTGPVLLFINIFRDIIIFCVHCYQTDLDTNYFELKSDHYISNEILEKCTDVLKNYEAEGNRIVELSNAICDVRSQINVHKVIYTKIFGQPPKGENPDDYTPKKCQDILQAFNIFKKMLVNNCSRIDNFDEIVKNLIDDPKVNIEVKQTSIEVIDVTSILSFIKNILTIRVLHKVMISEQYDLFSEALEKRNVLLKELESLYGTYKIDETILANRVLQQLELYMTRSIAFCNTKRVFEALEFSPKNHMFLTHQNAKKYEKVNETKSRASKGSFRGNFYAIIL